MRSYPLTEAEFKTIYSQVTRLTVELLIKTNEGIVLVQRGDHGWKDMWHIPGGTVYYRESLQDAISRVGNEELGVKVSQGKLLGYIEWASEAEARGFGYTVSMEFECSTLDQLPGQNEQGEAIKVFPKLPDTIIDEHRSFLLSQWPELGS